MGVLKAFAARRPYLLLFLVALGVRALYLLQTSGDSPFFDSPINDAMAYDQRARDVLKNGLLGGDRSPFWQAPGYHYFLALIYIALGTRYLAVYAVQSLMGALNCVFIARLGERFFGKRAGLLAGTAAAFYGIFVFFDGELLPTTLTLFLNLLMLLAGLKAADTGSRRTWALAGLFYGLSLLVRSDVAFFGLAAVLAIWLKAAGADLPRRLRRTAESGAAFFLAAALAVLPAAARNYAVSKDFVAISWNGGVNFYIGNGPEFPQSIDTVLGNNWMMLITEPHREGGARTKSEHSKYFYRKSLRFITEHPDRFVGNLFIKTFHALNGLEIWRNTNLYFNRDWSGLFALLVWRWKGIGFPFGLIGPLGLAGMILAWGRRRELVLLYGYGAAYFAALVLFFVTERYRAPLVPVLILFAAHAADAAWRAARAGEARSLRRAGAAFFGFLLLFNAGIGHFEGGPALQNHFYMGRAHLHRDRIAEAIENFNRAKGIPGYARPYVYAARTYERQKDFRRALEEIEAALRVNPDDFEALELGARYLLNSRQYGKARGVLARAARHPLTNKKAVRRMAAELEKAGGGGRSHAAIEAALAPQNLSKIVATARRAFDAAVRKEPPPDPAELGRAEIGPSRDVIVTVLVDGKAIAQANGNRRRLLGSAADAGLRAAREAAGKADPETLAKKARLDVDIVTDEKVFPRWDAATLEREIALGRDGAVLDLLEGRKVARGVFLKPSDTGMKSHEALLGELVGRLGIDRSQLAPGRTLLRKFTTVEVLEDPAAPEGYVLKSAPPSPGRPAFDPDSPSAPAYVPLSAVDDTSVKTSAELAAEWLVRNQTEEGFFMYLYDPERNAVSPSNELTRQAGTAAVLAAAGKALGKPAYLPAARACAERILSRHVDWLDGAKKKAFIRAPGDRDHLGQTALLVWAMYEVGMSGEKELAVMRSLADGILTLQQDDGSFETQFLKKGSRVGESFYSGEATLALALAYRATGESRYLDAALKAYRHYREVWRKRPSLGFATLQTESGAELYRITRDPEIARYVVGIGRWALRHQYGETDAPHRSFVGGTVSRPHPMRPYNSTLLEILAESAGLAREIGDADAHRQLSAGARRAARFAMNVQVKEREAAGFAEPSRAVGAYRQLLESSRLQVDVTAHTLLGMLKAIGHASPEEGGRADRF